MFKNIIMFTSLVFVHELGHFFVAKIFKWNIDKIYFYPYGGFTKFNEELNKPKYQELFIMLSGPITQVVYYLLLIKFNFLSFYDMSLFTNYHYSILFFNLLPIYPLDGGKFFNILLNYYFSFRKSLKLIFLISYIVIFIFFVIAFLNKISFSLSSLLVIILVMCKLTQETKKEKYYFNKFLLERHLNNYKFSKIQVIKGIEYVKRDYKHVIYDGKTTKTEKEELAKYFGNL